MRVLALRDANETDVNIYGYGTYVGDEPCPYFYDIPNPKIVLDSGEVVWGCECWWGDIEKMEEKFFSPERKLNVVKIDREQSD